MKLDVLENEDVNKSDDFESIEYEIAEGQGALLFKILSQYSNPIGSLVRELVTNAFDSHIEAGINKSVDVRINEGGILSGTNQSFEVEDYGVGLSSKRVKEIFSKFLASTKRHGNKEHGAFGLGSKSPLSYCDLFYVVTRHDGTEYTYTITKTRKAPEINLFDKEPTDKTNGTRIVVPIEQGDKRQFRREISRQLQYFDNINYSNCDVDNNYTIYRGKNFLYREDSPARKTHIVLGKVYYPIDWNNIYSKTDDINHLSGVKTPIALKFEIGELPVVWNRENIEYTEDAIDTIVQRLEDAQEELQKLYDKKHGTVHSLEEYLEAKNRQRKDELEIADGVFIPRIGDMVEREITYSKYKELPDLPNDVFFDFKTHRKVVEGLVNSHQGLQKVKTLVNKPEEPIFYCKDSYSTKVNKYIYHNKGHRKFHIIKKKPDSDLSKDKDLAYKFNFNRQLPTDHQEKLIGKFREEVENYIENNVPIYDDITVPDSFDKWLKKQKPKSSTSKRNYNPDKEVPYKPLTFKDGFFSGSTLKRHHFNRDHIKIRDLVDSSCPMIYGHRADSDTLRQASAIIFSRDEFYEHTDMFNDRSLELKKKRVMVFKISKSNASLIEDKENAIHVDDFMKSNHRIITKFVTAKYVYEEYLKDIFNDINSGELQEADSESYNRYKELKSFVSRVIGKPNDYRTARYREKEIYAEDWGSLIELFRDEDLIEDKWIEEAKRLIAFLDKYPLIKYVDLETKEATEEFEKYMDAKGEVNPMLLKRLEQFKQQKQDNA